MLCTDHADTYLVFISIAVLALNTSQAVNSSVNRIHRQQLFFTLVQALLSTVDRSGNRNCEMKTHKDSPNGSSKTKQSAVNSLLLTAVD